MELDERCDVDDIWGCPVDEYLVGRDVDAWIDDPRRRRDRTAMNLRDACGHLELTTSVSACPTRTRT